jgi:hypothetical protein
LVGKKCYVLVEGLEDRGLGRAIGVPEAEVVVTAQIQAATHLTLEGGERG